MPQSVSDSESWIAQARAARIQPWVKPADHLLEYGASNDHNVRAVQAAKKTLAGANGEPMPRPQTAQEADVILCSEVLEYLEDPAAVIASFKNSLRPGGLLVAFAIYDDAFRHPNLQETDKHLYSWNVQTLGNLMVDCGYEFVSGRVIRVPNEPLALALARRLNLGERGFLWAGALSRLLRPKRLVEIVARRGPDRS